MAATLRSFLVNNRIKVLTAETYIISSCIIDKNIVLKNGYKIFEEGNVKLSSFLLSLYQHVKIDYPKFYKMDNLSKLGWLASEILIKDESVIKQHRPEDIGLVITNANASLDTDIKYYQTVDMASPALFVYTLSNIVIGEICIRNNFKGENACFVFEHFNATFLKEYVDDLFANQQLKLCICGWVDVLQEDYKALLFLVAAGKQREDSIRFDEENMNRVFKSI